MKVIKSWAFAALSATVSLGLLIASCADASSYTVRPNMSKEDTAICLGSVRVLIKVGKLTDFKEHSDVHMSRMTVLSNNNKMKAIYEIGTAHGAVWALIAAKPEAVKIASTMYMKAVCIIPTM